MSSYAVLFTRLIRDSGMSPNPLKEFDEHQDDSEAYLQELDTLISSHLHGKGRVVAVGECGLGTFRC